MSLVNGELAFEPPKIRRGTIVDAILDDTAVLARDVTLPKLSKKKATEALRLDLMRSTPEDLDGLIWSSAKSDGSKSSHRQFVCKTATVAAIREHLASRNAVLRTVAPESSPDAWLVDRRSETDRPVHLWWAAALLFAFGFSGLLALSEMRQIDDLRRRLARMQAANTEATARLMELRSGTDAALQQASDLSSLEQRIRASLGKTAFLAAITDAMDDSAWMPSARINSDHAEIAVISAQSMPEVIDALSAVSKISSVTPVTPASLDRRTGLSRFDLRLEVKHD